MKVAVDKNKRGITLEPRSSGYLEVKLADLDYADDIDLRSFEEHDAEMANTTEAIDPCNRRETWSQDELQKDRDHVHRASQRFQPHCSTWKRRSHQGSGLLQIPWTWTRCGEIETSIWTPPK